MCCNISLYGWELQINLLGVFLGCSYESCVTFFACGEINCAVVTVVVLLMANLLGVFLGCSYESCVAFYS